MIIGFTIIAVLVLWGVTVRRRLVGMNENVNHAMKQIGVQLSSLFDALAALLNLTKEYAANECKILIETIKSRRSVISAVSTPEDVIAQERMISEILGRISMIAEQYPELKANGNYTKCMNAIENYEKMLRTSRLIYNDHVTRLNLEQDLQTVQLTLQISFVSKVSKVFKIIFFLKLSLFIVDKTFKSTTNTLKLSSEKCLEISRLKTQEQQQCFLVKLLTSLVMKKKTKKHLWKVEFQQQQRESSWESQKLLFQPIHSFQLHPSKKLQKFSQMHQSKARQTNFSDSKKMLLLENLFQQEQESKSIVQFIQLKQNLKHQVKSFNNNKKHSSECFFVVLF